MAKKHVVEIQVPKREGFAGYYSAQQHFAHGTKHKVEVDSKQLRELQEDSKEGRVMLTVLEEGDYSDDAQTQSALAGLAPDERALIEAHRAKSAKQGDLVRSPMNDSGIRGVGQPELDTRTQAEKDAADGDDEKHGGPKKGKR